jgi:hypothetical protein
MAFEITSLKAAYEPYHSRKNEPYRWSNKLYIWPEGETVMENLFNRRNRPSRAWKQTLIPAIMAKLSKENPEIFERVKGEDWGWRQNCGCKMCPCSPGFVGKNDGQYTISVQIKFFE